MMRKCVICGIETTLFWAGNWGNGKRRVMLKSVIRRDTHAQIPWDFSPATYKDKCSQELGEVHLNFELGWTWISLRGKSCEWCYTATRHLLMIIFLPRVFAAIPALEHSGWMCGAPRIHSSTNEFVFSKIEKLPVPSVWPQVGHQRVSIEWWCISGGVYIHFFTSKSADMCFVWGRN